MAVTESKGVVVVVVVLFDSALSCSHKLHKADESYRDIAVNNQQLFSCHIELAAQFIGLPVDYSESLMVWVKD